MLTECTPRLTHPYLSGVLLATNAVADAYLLVDGPSCVLFRAQEVFGRHDWRSTLLHPSGRHRVAHTGLDMAALTAGHAQRLHDNLRRLLLSGLPGVVLVGTLPVADLVGLDHARIVAGALAGVSIPTALLPARALGHDWLRGYADAMAGLAEVLPLDDAAPRAGAVALVGLLTERNEEDGRGNVRELRRLLRALGQEVVSTWLDGGPTEELVRAGEAELVVSLPHGRAAAATVARRTGARLVEVELPFGVDATDRFLRAVAAAGGVEARAEEVIRAAHAEVAALWEAPVLRRLSGQVLAFTGDPYRIRGLCELCELLGIEVARLVATAHETAARREAVGDTPLPVAWAPRAGALTTPASAVRLEVSDASSRPPRVPGAPSPALVELGFPCQSYHATFDAPTLGYRGAACFVDRLQGACGPAGA